MTAAWLALPIIAVFGILAWLAIWSRQDTWARPAAVVLFLFAIPVIGTALAETLGRHKPFSIAWDMTADRYHVLAAVMVQDEAIYLYILDPERAEPRPVVIPWDNETANSMQRAMDEAPEGQEGQFIFDQGYGDEHAAHPLPQPAAPPPKDEPDTGLIYEPGND